MRDPHDLEDARQVLERGRVDRALVAGQPDGGSLRPGNRVGLETAPLRHGDDSFDVARRGVAVHDDEHASSSIPKRRLARDVYTSKRRPNMHSRRARFFAAAAFLAGALLVTTLPALAGYTIYLKDGGHI